MTTPGKPKKARTYRHVTKDVQTQIRAERVAALEQEHYSNVLALQVAQAQPAGEARDQQVAQLQANLASLDAALEVLDPA